MQNMFILLSAVNKRHRVYKLTMLYVCVRACTHTASTISPFSFETIWLISMLLLVYKHYAIPCLISFTTIINNTTDAQIC